MRIIPAALVAATAAALIALGAGPAAAAEVKPDQTVAEVSKSLTYLSTSDLQDNRDM